ncbi:hypothetical protein [Lysobacter sp. Root494]|uniref:hypothetical protein n=1 Tax=Lysobacter sp. Root494 TaxID=1736549 RepID=UPI000AD05271|nr:hypothetical protein [Lysobacter sp. Root494]
MKISPNCSALAKQLPGLANGLSSSLNALAHAPDPSSCEEVVIQLEITLERCLILASEMDPKHPQWSDAPDLLQRLFQRLRAYDSAKEPRE